MKVGTVVMPDEAPNWLSAVISNMQDWVLNLRRGPQAMTPYTAAKLPSAVQFPRSFIYDATTNLPMFSDASGNWHDLVVSGFPGSFTTLSIAQGAIISGVYTPSLTNTANVGSSSALQCQYIRVGNVVNVSGAVTLTPTLLATLTTLGISLPVASTLSATSNLGGTAANSSVASNVGPVFADTANNRATLQLISVGTGSETFSFAFQYLVT